MELKDIKDPSVKIDKKSLTDSQKKVGFWFGLGIFIAPYIFGWFTLREGYSRQARLITFSWLFIILIANFNKPNQQTRSTASFQNTTENSVTQESAHNDSPRWVVGRYTDDFNRPTKNKVASIEKKIEGKFSNSATTDSKLLVDILVEKNKTSFRLYEYGGTTEAKIFSPQDYRLKVLDKNGKTHTLDISNEYYGINLVGSSSSRLRKILKDGGEILFSIKDTSASSSSYNFSIPPTQGFDEALKKL